MIDLKAIRKVALSAAIYWPPETDIKSGRWNSIDTHINTMTPQTVIALLDMLEAAEAKIKEIEQELMFQRLK